MLPPPFRSSFDRIVTPICPHRRTLQWTGDFGFDTSICRRCGTVLLERLAYLSGKLKHYEFFQKSRAVTLSPVRTHHVQLWINVSRTCVSWISSSTVIVSPRTLRHCLVDLLWKVAAWCLCSTILTWLSQSSKFLTEVNYILDEIVMSGMVLETSLREIVNAVGWIHLAKYWNHLGKSNNFLPSIIQVKGSLKYEEATATKTTSTMLKGGKKIWLSGLAHTFAGKIYHLEAVCFPVGFRGVQQGSRKKMVFKILNGLNLILEYCAPNTTEFEVLCLVRFYASYRWVVFFV